ncbi:helix-turn-helix transcriptional regulator [Marinobacter sp. M1N3S26]|uniref:helix-turn-helix transcriptional regulator n=1 Tax=Marinobacter sp. M1N3S26 TaxID=3382299 RepID=UPI00387B906A
MSFTPARTTESRLGDSPRVMLISDHRVFYFGLLGRPGLRNFGCATLYVAEQTPMEVDLGNGWQRHQVCWVPPYTPHRVRTRDRQLAIIMVEPEYTDIDAVGSHIRQRLKEDATALRNRILGGGRRFRRLSPDTRLGDGAFDNLLFGRRLPPGDLDPRVGRVVDHLCHHSDDSRSAATLAREEGLSQSRFLHLFKEQTGICLRKYRAWRRARSLLYHVRSSATLTDIALETGYPDSTHFSHSIRRIYGLPPREIVSGSRRLQIHVQEPASAASACRTLAASSHKRPWQTTAMV